MRTRISHQIVSIFYIWTLAPKPNASKQLQNLSVHVCLASEQLHFLDIYNDYYQHFQTIFQAQVFK